MKDRDKKEVEQIKKDIQKKGILFIKDMLDYCEKKKISPIVIAEVLQILTQGYVVSLLATEKGVSEKEFKKLMTDVEDIPDKKLGMIKLIEAIAKREKEESDLSYRS